MFREHRSWTPEPIVSPFPGVNMFGGRGGSPSIDQAMRVSAVWACVRLLADTVSMMPLTAYTMAAGVRVPTNDPPLLRQPSGDASMSDWLYMVMVSLLLRGNAYGKISLRDRDGYPVQIDILSPDEVQTRRDIQTGKLVYSTRGGVILRNEDLWHVRAFRLPGSSLGLSPIQYAASQINTDAAIQAFGLGWFLDAPNPKSVLTSDQSINKEQARTILDSFKTKKGNEPLVLGAGLKYTPLSVSPNESQFIETQKYSVASIARMYGVAPEMIAAEAGNSMTYANIESKGIDFLTYGVQPWLTRIEAAVAPLMPGQRHARFDPSILVRTDLEGRTKAGAIAIASKQQTPDEVRAWSDLPPLTEAQKAWLEIVPLTVSPTGMPKALPKAFTATSEPNVDPAATEGEPA
jgi:HK97 family phage portal protein